MIIFPFRNASKSDTSFTPVSRGIIRNYIRVRVAQPPSLHRSSYLAATRRFSNLAYNTIAYISNTFSFSFSL